MGLININEWFKAKPEKAHSLKFEPEQIQEVHIGDEREAFNQSGITAQQVGYAGNGLIDLSLDQWKGMKGIGPKLAKRLVESGPYHELDLIKDVKGISNRMMESISEEVKSILIPCVSASSSGDVLDAEDSSN